MFTKLFLDTDPRVEQLVVELYRKKSVAQRIEMAINITETARNSSYTSRRSQYPEESESQIRLRFARIVLGNDLAEKVCASSISGINGESTRLKTVFQSIITTLDNLGIPYFVGGSLAATGYGMPHTM